jgi:arginine/lysine/ornithine decarboxylase
VDVVHINFSIAFDRVLHGLLKFNLSMGSYLTGRTQRVKLDDYLSEAIQSFRSSSKKSPILFILDINKAFNLGYADDLKFFMIVKSIGDCQIFQKDLQRSNSFDLSNSLSSLFD